MDRDMLVEQLQEYFQVDVFDDGCVNGLQVEGTKEIVKIITGVSCNQALIDRAVEEEADMIIVHHGLFYGRGPLAITGVLKKRLETLLTHNINLVGMHLPLDYHEEVGNGPELLLALGCTDLSLQKGEWCGVFPIALSKEEFLKKVQEVINPNVMPVMAGTDQIRTVMAVTGAAPRYVHKAMDAGMDVFVTGEIKEDVVDLVTEEGMNFVSCGHYATEVFGPQALARILRERFNLNAEFIAIPNIG